MIAFPHMLASAAKEAGIPVPPDNIIDEPNKYRESYPQYFILVITQCGRPMTHGEHWENAKRLSKIPVGELKTLTAKQLQERGVNCGV